MEYVSFSLYNTKNQTWNRTISTNNNIWITAEIIKWFKFINFMKKNKEINFYHSSALELWRVNSKFLLNFSAQHAKLLVELSPKSIPIEKQNIFQSIFDLEKLVRSFWWLDSIHNQPTKLRLLWKVQKYQQHFVVLVDFQERWYLMLSVLKSARLGVE